MTAHLSIRASAPSIFTAVILLLLIIAQTEVRRQRRHDQSEVELSSYNLSSSSSIVASRNSTNKDVLFDCCASFNRTLIPKPFPVGGYKDDDYAGLLLEPHTRIHRHSIQFATLVSVEHKLILFPIRKVGSTVFRQLFRRMGGYDDWRSNPHMYGSNGIIRLFNFTPCEAESMLRDPTWTRAVFYRDPKT